MDSDINYIIHNSLIGDKKSQEILLEKLKPLIFKNIYKYFRADDSKVDDMVQEGYIVILQALNDYDKKQNVHFLQYVKIKIEFFYKNYYRSNKNNNEISLSEEIGENHLELEKILQSNIDVIENLISIESSLELLACVKKLNLDEQNLIMLYYFKNVPLVKISRLYNIPYSTLQRRKKKSLDKLKEMLGEVR